MTSLINRSRDAPDHDGGIGTALAHYGHPCGCRHLHGLCNIGNSNQQNVPCDRMESEYPSGIPGFTGKQHHEMDAESQYHRNIHGEDCGENIILIGCDRCDGSLRSDTRPQIGGENHARVAAQRWIAKATTTVNNPQKYWIAFVLVYLASISVFSAFTMKE